MPRSRIITRENAQMHGVRLGDKVILDGIEFQCFKLESRFNQQTKEQEPGYRWRSKCVDCGQQKSQWTGKDHVGDKLKHRCPGCRVGKNWLAATPAARKRQRLAQVHWAWARKAG